VAQHAASWHDPAHLGVVAVGAGVMPRVPARSWVLVREPADREGYLIVRGDRRAGAHSYKPGDATGGSEEAARFKA
jgi:hypothetical protein